MTGVPETVFDELKRYVGWGEADEQSLRALHGAAAPQFQRLAQAFYERILAHDGARTALVGGESQVGHLKVTMVAWLDQLLSGPWDEAYWDHRYRIGRVHVRIGLPQHYMFGAMNVHRSGLARIAYERFHADPVALEAGAQRARQDPRPRARGDAAHLPGGPARAAGARRAALDVRTARRLHRPRPAQPARRDRDVALHPPRRASARTSARGSTSTASASSSASRTGSSRTCST